MWIASLEIGVMLKGMAALILLDCVASFKCCLRKVSLATSIANLGKDVFSSITDLIAV